MIVSVFHRIDADFRDNTPETLAAFPEGFEYVADVAVDDIGAVFQMTNHIDENWLTSIFVVPVSDRAKRGLARSTSVGDVFCAQTDRVRYTVDGIGMRTF